MKEKILIIEDNRDVSKMLEVFLKDQNYQVVSALNGLEGLRMIKEQVFDIVLLDIMLPYKSGDEILRDVRTFSDVPIIIISAKDMIGTKIDLLKMGADDYITKPFDLGEVAARVETTLRRYQKTANTEKVHKYKDIVVDDSSKRIIVNDLELELTAKEYRIIELMLKNKDKVFTKANLYETIWEDAYLGDDNAVKTHMSNLRSKLKFANPKEEYIETVWGLGYRLFKD